MKTLVFLCCVFTVMLGGCLPQLSIFDSPNYEPVYVYVSPSHSIDEIRTALRSAVEVVDPHWGFQSRDIRFYLNSGSPEYIYWSFHKQRNDVIRISLSPTTIRESSKKNITEKYNAINKIVNLLPEYIETTERGLPQLEAVEYSGNSITRFYQTESTANLKTDIYQCTKDHAPNTYYPFRDFVTLMPNGTNRVLLEIDTQNKDSQQIQTNRRAAGLTIACLNQLYEVIN